MSDPQSSQDLAAPQRTWQLLVSVAILIFGIQYLIVFVLMLGPLSFGEPPSVFILVPLIFGLISLFLAVKTRRKFVSPWSKYAMFWLAFLALLFVISTFWIGRFF